MLHPSPHQYEHHEPVVELQSVTCGYGGVAVVEHADLKIARGDFVGLLGPSGSGKTTLLKSILGAADVYEGDVLVNGRSIKDKRPTIGYVPQLETIDWEFPVTVEQVVMMGLIRKNRFFPWFRQEERDHAYSIMERLGIAEFGKRHIRQLSGGQQQRAFLARALVSDPSLLLLDEPTSGVDIKTRDEVMHLLDELNHQDITILLTTHEINAVAAHLPWVVCMNGRIVAEGPPSDVFTPEVLKETYNAEIHITEYQGMKLVAESPHYFGRNDRQNHEHETVAGD
ncbi:MAG TPA: ABC transporter [Dehalococcoidia bacterium]|nr:ABC transporter [Dehalococcoidia bacterium]HIM90519.1 metal ABC transporter ATP-binding protein [Dehalococcoidia bacterium]